MNDSPELENLRRFHGHLGPYAALGFRVGQYALARVHGHAHFGVEAEVRCAGQTPESCLLDGIQFSTGCTMGKRNLVHTVGQPVQIRLRNRETGEDVVLGLREQAVEEAVRRMREVGEENAVQFICALPMEELITEPASR
jgi:formylmethanofuran dehydrogenase subunit E